MIVWLLEIEHYFAGLKRTPIVCPILVENSIDELYIGSDCYEIGILAKIKLQKQTFICIDTSFYMAVHVLLYCEKLYMYMYIHIQCYTRLHMIVYVRVRV